MTLEDLVQTIANILYLNGGASSKASALTSATLIVSKLNAGGFLTNIKEA